MCVGSVAREILIYEVKEKEIKYLSVNHNNILEFILISFKYLVNKLNHTGGRVSENITENEMFRMVENINSMCIITMRYELYRLVDIPQTRAKYNRYRVGRGLVILIINLVGQPL